MSDLTFGLIGLALLPLILVFFASNLPDKLKVFRIILFPMALLCGVIFFWQIGETAPTLYAPVWSINTALIGITLLYLWVEGLTFLKAIHSKATGGA